MSSEKHQDGLTHCFWKGPPNHDSSAYGQEAGWESSEGQSQGRKSGSRFQKSSHPENPRTPFPSSLHSQESSHQNAFQTFLHGMRVLQLRRAPFLLFPSALQPRGMVRPTDKRAEKGGWQESRESGRCWVSVTPGLGHLGKSHFLVWKVEITTSHRVSKRNKHNVSESTLQNLRSSLNASF